MTATLQNLYDDIKELIHQKFETKTEEDTTLPEIVELYFNYNQGELNVSGVTSTEPLVFIFTGTELTQYSSGEFSGSNMFIDYGDGTIEKTTGRFGHTYEESGTYKVKIYGVTSLGNYCFKNCTGLTSINIPNNVSSLGIQCFYNCTGLTSIEIPSNVTSLGNDCFYNCTGLTSIEIPSNVTSLGARCFFGCTGLTSIEIPSNVTSLGTSCFARCTGLTSIEIPSNVTSLGASCFFDCTGLTSIEIPDNVTSLGAYCFRGCTGLTSIILNWTDYNLITYQSGWIMDTNSNLKLYIPTGTTEDYIEADYPSDKLVESD